MNFYGQTAQQLQIYLEEIGEKSSKIPILLKSIYQQPYVGSFQHMDINDKLIQRLSQDFALTLPTIVETVRCEDTTKFLLKLEDGQMIEAVWMRQKYGNSLCISTQIGCNMACDFCQSGRYKKTRNLTTAEMTTQIIAIAQAQSIAIDNVILMGIGEPFDNYPQVMDFLSIATHPWMLALGQRHISVSTCGIVPRIYDYTSHPAKGLLAVSLHAPNNALRDQLMPINRLYPLEQLMEAIAHYIQHTGKKVMLEYVMLAGINDSTTQALELVQLIGHLNCHVNLIAYNQTEQLQYQKSAFEQIMAFYHILKQHHIKVTIRREFGTQLQAACGQLRADALPPEHSL